MRPSRPVPAVGAPAEISRGNAWVVLPIEAVLDEGRTVVVDGRTFTLRKLTGEWVLDGEPYWGPRCRLLHDPDTVRRFYEDE